MTTALDLRHRTETDKDFVRVRGALAGRLRRSIDQYRRDIRTERPDAQNRFVARHTALLVDGFRQAQREGVMDYAEAFSTQPRAFAKRILADPMVRERLSAEAKRVLPFFTVSVAKMAVEGQQAWQAQQVQTRTFAEGDEDPMERWGGTLDTRIMLQADVTWAGFQAGYVESGVYDDAKPFIKLYWDLEPDAQHCTDCPRVAALSPYDPPSGDYGANVLRQTPGDGQTECGAKCKCDLRYGPSEGGMPMDRWANVWPRGTPPGLLPSGAVKAPKAPFVTKTQAGVLDGWRLAQRYWNQQRAGTNLPDLPPMFDPNGDLAAVDWEALTPEQQKALRWALMAQQQWVDVTGGEE